jgi:hypothetical protein
VSERVVDLLELVEIDEHERRAQALVLGARERMLHPLAQQRPVG